MRRNFTNEKNLKLYIPIQPNIGLDEEARHSVMKILNTIQADEAVLAIKTNNAHSQVYGPGFLELHTLFDQQLYQLNMISDEIEERVCVLGGFTISSSFEEFLHCSRLEEPLGEAPDIISLLADQEAFIRFLREDARKCFEEYEDQGTFALLVSVMRTHEKMAWMLRTYIEPELTDEEKEENKI